MVRPAAQQGVYIANADIDGEHRITEVAIGTERAILETIEHVRIVRLGKSDQVARRNGQNTRRQTDIGLRAENRP